MTMKKANVEFVEFDARDVITTSNQEIIPTSISVLYFDKAGFEYYNAHNQESFSNNELTLSDNYKFKNDGSGYVGFGTLSQGNIIATHYLDNRPDSGYYDLASNHELLAPIYYWLNENVIEPTIRDM